MAGILTIGHSTLSREAFLELLDPTEVEELWDVRSYPTSRWDWFHREQLACWLPEAGVAYRWVPALGGRRSERQAREAREALAGKTAQATQATAVAPQAPPDETRWRESGFATYQWHMTTEEFFAAADELVELGRRRTVAILCSELLWWRCHRSLIADYLVTAGAEVVHLQPRRLEHSEVVAERLPRYSPPVLGEWRRHLQRAPGA